MAELALKYIPPELVEIILGNRPWAALVLSHRWRKWALEIIMAVPIHGIPRIHKACRHTAEYQRLLAKAESPQGRSNILVCGEYTLYSSFGDGMGVYQVTFKPNMTIVRLYRDDNDKRVLIDTMDGCLQIGKCIEFFDMDGVMVILEWDYGTNNTYGIRTYRYEHTDEMVCCWEYRNRVIDTNCMHIDEIAFRPINPAYCSINIYRYMRLCRMLEILKVEAPEPQIVQRIAGFRLLNAGQ